MFPKPSAEIGFRPTTPALGGGALSTELLGQRRFIVHGHTPSRIMFAWQLAQAIRQP